MSRSLEKPRGGAEMFALASLALGRCFVRGGAQGAGADAAAEDRLVFLPLLVVQDLARLPHRLLEVRVALAVQVGELFRILSRYLFKPLLLLFIQQGRQRIVAILLESPAVVVALLRRLAHALPDAAHLLRLPRA